MPPKVHKIHHGAPSSSQQQHQPFAYGGADGSMPAAADGGGVRSLYRPETDRHHGAAAAAASSYRWDSQDAAVGSGGGGGLPLSSSSHSYSHRSFASPSPITSTGGGIGGGGAISSTTGTAAVSYLEQHHRSGTALHGGAGGGGGGGHGGTQPSFGPSFADPYAALPSSSYYPPPPAAAAGYPQQQQHQYPLPSLLVPHHQQQQHYAMGGEGGRAPSIVTSDYDYGLDGEESGGGDILGAAAMMGGMGNGSVPLPMPPPSNLVRNYAQLQRKQQQQIAGAAEENRSNAAKPSATTTATRGGSGVAAVSDALLRPTQSSLAKKGGSASTNNAPTAASGPTAARGRVTSPSSATAARRAAAAVTTTSATASSTSAPTAAANLTGAALPIQQLGQFGNSSSSGEEAVQVLIKYKQYVETKLTPQLQRSMDAADRLQAELDRSNKALEATTAALEESKGTVARLRIVLDQERLASDGAHQQQLEALRGSHAEAVGRLQAEGSRIAEELQRAQADVTRMVQLERLLEMRDGEIRRLKVTMAAQQQHQQQQNPAGLNGTAVATSSSGVGGGEMSLVEQLMCGNNGNANSNSSGSDLSSLYGTISKELEALVHDSLSYLQAVTTACNRAGVGPDAFGPSAQQWRHSELVQLSQAIITSSSSSSSSPIFAANVLSRVLARVKVCLREERSCVTSALGAVVSLHADTLGSVGDRELEMAKIRDVHQQRIEELERDFDTQLRLLQTQLQHQGQYLHGGGGGVVGPSSPLRSPMQQQQQQQSRGGVGGGGAIVGGGAANAAYPNSSGSDSLYGYDASMAGWGRPSAGSSSGAQSGGGRGSGAVSVVGGPSGSVPSRTCATQTALDISVLFPAAITAAAAAGGGGGGGGFGNSSASGGQLGRRNSNPSRTAGGGGGGGGGPSSSSAAAMSQAVAATSNNAHLVSAVALLRSDEIDGAAVSRLVEELLVLEGDNSRLTAENAMLKEERRRHLFFMRMGNVTAREEAVMAHGSVTDLLLN